MGQFDTGQRRDQTFTTRTKSARNGRVGPGQSVRGDGNLQGQKGGAKGVLKGEWGEVERWKNR